MKIFQALYLFLPGFVANAAAVYRKILPDLDIPIDGGLKLGGEPLFGKNKTWRGFAVGTLAGMTTITVQRFLFEMPFFAHLSLLQYADVPWLAIGAAMGFGAMTGDLVKSFVKRRLKRNPGAPFFPWDQIDQVLGSWLFLAIWYSPPGEIMAIVLVAVVFLTPLVNRLAYRWGMKNVPW